MAKTKTTTHKFYVVDLVRNKPPTKFITIPKYRVDIVIEVTTKGIFSASDVPSSALKRLEEAARSELDRYETVIAQEAAALDAKIAALMQSPSPKAKQEAEKMTQATDQMIKNALRSAQGAADKAIEVRLKKEAQGDKNLKEARFKTGLKWTLGVVKITGSVAKLVGTMGADVTSYVTITKQLVTLGLDLKQQLKNEEKLRKDLENGIQAFITLRGTTILQAAKRQGVTDTSGIDVRHPLEAIKTVALKVKASATEVAKGKDAKTVAKDALDFVIKGVKTKLNDAEKARTAYREHTTKTRHKTDSLSAKADGLKQAMKAAKGLKEGIKIGAECMSVKRGVTVLADKLKQREAFLEEMQELMKGNGLTIDDQTTLQKIRKLDKMTILTEAATVYSAISAISKTVKAVAKVAS